MAQPMRVALVTGGIGGIGTSICQRLAKDGMRVVANYHPMEQEQAEAWLAARQAEGLDISIAVGDVSSWDDTQRMIAEVLEKAGPVDVLVNCAGITRDKTFKRMELAQWEAVINVNLNSVFNVTRPLWDGMLERGFGRIINISSVNGQRGQFGQGSWHPGSQRVDEGLHLFLAVGAVWVAVGGDHPLVDAPGCFDFGMLGHGEQCG